MTVRENYAARSPLFPNSRTGVEHGDDSSLLARRPEEVKAPPLRFDLRHTAASEVLRCGILREVHYVLGHTTARMVERYAHFAPDPSPVEGALLVSCTNSTRILARETRV